MDVDYSLLVARLRSAQTLTQEGLARELGVTFSTVNGWERGRHLPSPLARRVLLKLAEDAGLRADGTSNRKGEAAR